MAPVAGGFLRSLRRELAHGVLSIALLEELERGPSYGYALLGALRNRFGGEVELSPARLYPALARLRSFGLVRVFHGSTSLGPVRKYYELTAEGRAVLPEIRALSLALRSGRSTSTTTVAPLPAARSARTGG